MSDVDVDVAVIGAGPAGSAAAIVAARAGRRVLLLDRASSPRDKCCGDGLTSAALRLLEELGLDPTDVPSWQPVHDVVFHSPSGRRASLPLSHGGAMRSVVARRWDLDAALVRLAVDAGVEVRTGTACTGVDATDTEAIRVRLADGSSVTTGSVVAADGVWSPVRRWLGVPFPESYRGEFHAFRQYFANTGPDAAAMHVVFADDLLPGYAWSFPLPDGRANVGFGVPRGGAVAVGAMRDRWTALLRSSPLLDVLGARAGPEGPLRAWPIPARIDHVTLAAAGGRVLFAGDAAAATDPLTGEGIAQALLTGMRAASAFVTAGAHRPALAADLYHRDVHRDLVPDHRLARGLARVVARPRGLRLSIAAADLSPWTRRNFARWLFEDYPRALLLTPRRWGRGALQPPPAYGTRLAPSPRTVPAR